MTGLYTNNVLANITPRSSAPNQGPWNALEAHERALAKRLNVVVYIYTGPLVERLMAPLPAGSNLQRVPPGCWKVVALEDGRMTAFVFGQASGRSMAYCDGRTSLERVVLRSRLRLFPMADPATFRSLDADLGCNSTKPADPAPGTIPED